MHPTKQRAFKGIVLSGLVTAALAAFVACAPAAPPVPTPAPTAAPTATAVPTGPLLKVAKDAKLGNILTDREGKVVYLFTRDERGKSSYTGTSWVPLTGKFSAGDGLTAALIGESIRADGTKAVSYNGWPLHYYTRDEKAGDTNGEAVGGVWFAISADGAPIQTNAVIKSVANSVGTLVTDASGRSVYMFAKDEKGKSACSGDCLRAWPPLLTVGDAKPDQGVTATLVGTLKRDDGSTQVTYNGLPLYYFSADGKPGDMAGQLVNGFNGLWYLMSATGDTIKTAVSGGAGASGAAGSGY